MNHFPTKVTKATFQGSMAVGCLDGVVGHTSAQSLRTTHPRCPNADLFPTHFSFGASLTLTLSNIQHIWMLRAGVDCMGIIRLNIDSVHTLQ